MGIGEFCTRDVVFVRRNESVADAARLMRQHHVGSLVVVDDWHEKHVPAGIITDRDITVGVVALGLDPEKRNVESVMPAEVVCARETDGVGRAVALMRAQGVRRLPVINRSGALAGIISADDILDLLAQELYGIAEMAARGESRERDQHCAA